MSPSAPDFASEAMVRVLARGMRDLGLQPPGPAAHTGQATVPLDLKRAWVQAAVAQGGLACLPLLGRGLHALALEPVHLALTVERDAGGMLRRWQRLERYIHSRHRVEVLELGDRFARVRHVHREGGPPPLAVEDLVVGGVLAALLEANGLAQVRLEAHGVRLYPDPDEAQVAALVQAGRTAEWRFAWAPAGEPATSPTGVSAALRSPVRTPLPDFEPAVPADWSGLARTVAERVARHLPQVPALAALAASLGLAPRSLQRALAAEGLSLTRIASDMRFRMAGWRLLHSGQSLAEIGFLCGYADQAHLTREFHRRMGLTPAKYQSLFGVPRG